jgi:RHS repeat-associated protein
MQQAVANGSKSEPKVVLPTDQLAARTEVELPESLRKDAPRSLSDSSFASGARPASSKPLAPVDPPVFTDDPLVAGVTAIKAVHVQELRDAVNQARARAALAAATWTDSSLQGVAIKAVHIVELRARLAEARSALGLSAASYTDPSLSAGAVVKAVHVQELRQRVTETLAVNSSCPPPQVLATDQFVKNFYQGAFNRQPNTTELQSWTDQLRQAYFQGQAQQLAVARQLGRQLFTSQEYLNRNRSDHDYVYDLYKGYLQREPDQAGWDFWTGQVASQGRDNVREGFAFSTEFPTKVSTLCPGNSTTTSGPIPSDGIANLSYDPASNRITTSGFSYDAAGNQTSAIAPYGGSQLFQYDAANRLINVQSAGAATGTYTYGAARERLVSEEYGLRTYYVWGGGAVIAEYIESGGATIPAWSKSYIYLGSRLLSTVAPNGTGGEYVQYDHPDRLGTRLVTNASDTSYFEQQTLPFGTPLNESPYSGATTGVTGRRFTSYEHSIGTGLDYAVNRHYDAQQGRFTQVDPSGMASTSLNNPQSLNLYAYCTNDPINQTDPSGLGFFSFLKKLFKWIAVAMAIVVAVVAVVTFGAVPLLETIRLALTAGSLLSHAMGWKRLARIFDIGLAIIDAYYRYQAAKRNVIIWNLKEGQEYPSEAMRIASWATLIGTIANFLQRGQKKRIKGAKGGVKGEVTNNDPEAPCANKGANVRKDIDRIAHLIDGRTDRGSVYTGQRYPGGGINPRGQSAAAIENKLLHRGFTRNYSLEHPEGKGFQSKHPFKDGLWYHVIINWPKETDWLGRADMSKATPLVTVHCHGTDPMSREHIIDELKRRIGGWIW